MEIEHGQKQTQLWPLLRLPCIFPFALLVKWQKQNCIGDEQTRLSHQFSELLEASSIHEWHLLVKVYTIWQCYVCCRADGCFEKSAEKQCWNFTQWFFLLLASRLLFIHVVQHIDPD